MPEKEKVLGCKVDFSFFKKNQKYCLQTPVEGLLGRYRVNLLKCLEINCREYRFVACLTRFLKLWKRKREMGR